MDLHGRVALVTGGSRGIGAASAIALARRGVRVALVGLEPGLLRATAGRCGPGASCHEADVADAASLRAAIDDALAVHGHLDVVFANAGVAVHGPLHRLAPADVARLLDVNLLGAAHTAWAATEALVASRGYLLFNASLAAVAGLPGLGPYAASKAGVDALAGVLRTELRPSGVAVGVAYFGFVETDMTAPLPARVKLPVSAAADAVVRAVEGRRARVVAPRWLAPAVPLRGVVRPLAERAFAARRGPRRRDDARMSRMEAPSTEVASGLMAILTDDEVREAVAARRSWRRVGDTLVRERALRDFGEALAFLERIGQAVEDYGRHPDIAITGGNRVRVIVSNANGAGFTDAELRLVDKVDEVADAPLPPARGPLAAVAGSSPEEPSAAAEAISSRATTVVAEPAQRHGGRAARIWGRRAWAGSPSAPPRCWRPAGASCSLHRSGRSLPSADCAALVVVSIHCIVARVDDAYQRTHSR